jgi:putative zinc finger/helix-turn-helix YgiT family protein
MAGEPNAGERREAPRLPDDACAECGAQMRPSRRALTLPVNGETVRVTGIPHLQCPSCGDTVTDFAQTGALWERAFARYRLKHRLLGPAEIRELRRHLSLTQARLAHLLRLGANTVSRWEAGRNVQTGAMDVLLRLLRDLPGSVAYLKRHAA